MCYQWWRSSKAVPCGGVGGAGQSGRRAPRSLVISWSEWVHRRICAAVLYYKHNESQIRGTGERTVGRGGENDSKHICPHFVRRYNTQPQAWPSTNVGRPPAEVFPDLASSVVLVGIIRPPPWQRRWPGNATIACGGTNGQVAHPRPSPPHQHRNSWSSTGC